MMNLQRFGQMPVHQLLMAIIGNMSSICTLSGLSYWLVSGNSESKLYMMTSFTVSLFGELQGICIWFCRFFCCISYSFKFLVPRTGMTAGHLPLLWRRQKVYMH